MARYRANFSHDRWDQAAAEHEEILGALARRDGPALAQILRSHLENTCQTVKAALGKDADRDTDDTVNAA